MALETWVNAGTALIQAGSSAWGAYAGIEQAEAQAEAEKAKAEALKSQAEAEKYKASLMSGGKGLSTGAIIGIVFAGVILTGVAVKLATKN